VSASPHFVGLISDTHGLIRPEALDALRDSDVIIHCGDIGDPAVLDALRTIEPVRAVRGNNDMGAWACSLPACMSSEPFGFTGDAGAAQAFVDLGFYVSFSGILTFRKVDALRVAAMIVPEDRLLIETDTPYLAPEPYRGKRNEPRLRAPHVRERHVAFA
jgi:Tat protein secretion system quality control protein TatD with DNase activity